MFLTNDPEPPKPRCKTCGKVGETLCRECEARQTKGRQRPLFSGLNCLPGQLDLFNTDGGDDGKD